MRKRFLITSLFVASFCIFGCNNQAKQQELEKQRQEDSIRVAEKVKKELAEKEAAERERQEAAERVERESRTWTGASSVDELKRKLIGTTWHCRLKEYSYIWKFVFSENSVKRFGADPRDGKWEDEYDTYSYSFNIVRDEDGKNQVIITLSNSSKQENSSWENIAFCNKCTEAYYVYGKTILPMIFGDFTWDDEL